ncbi:hypothetical protein [Asticcacaulis sp. W401b]|uniref:hypothetical protein n=1 Tax=Asticcacaulis sp. W401b TaxID=3388666 RepID=UPI0039705158
MTSVIWLSAALAALSLHTDASAVLPSPTCVSQCAPRDPIAFRPDDFSAFLDEMSRSPDVRISIAAARLSYHDIYAQKRAAYRPTPIFRMRVRRLKASKAQLSAEQIANQDLVLATARFHALDTGYFTRLARRESGFNHLARAPTSSASGLFQFTENTWLCTLRQYGAAYGVPDASDIVRSSGGRCRPPSLLSRWRLLALRYDPKLNAAMAAHHTRENTRSLYRILGRSPSAAELYTFHFFGADEGERFLRAPLSATAHLVTPKAASSNRTLFYDRTGRPRAIFEVRRHFEASFDQI